MASNLLKEMQIVKLINEALERHGVSQSAMTDRSTDILWLFHAFEKLSCVLRLYEVDGQSFLMIEVGLGVIQKGLDCSELIKRIAIENSRILKPVRLALYQGSSVDLIISQYWSNTIFINPDCVEDLIEEVIETASEFQGRFQSISGFEILPGHWFSELLN